MKADELGYIEELLGHWEIRYPGPDGMIVADYIESLELRIDGTFSWNPTPLWAKQNGRWGVTVDEESGQIRLYFEERNGGTYRGNWLVLAAVPLGGHSVVMLHWHSARGRMPWSSMIGCWWRARSEEDRGHTVLKLVDVVIGARPYAGPTQYRRRHRATKASDWVEKRPHHFSVTFADAWAYS